jgi:hypothetical protein
MRSKAASASPSIYCRPPTKPHLRPMCDTRKDRPVLTPEELEAGVAAYRQWENEYDFYFESVATDSAVEKLVLAVFLAVAKSCIEKRNLESPESER